MYNYLLIKLKNNRNKGIKENVEKAKTMFLYFFIFLVPQQTAKKFWIEKSIFRGRVIDYFLPSIYLLDFFIVGFILTSLVSLVLNWKKKEIGKKFVILNYLIFFSLFTVFNLPYLEITSSFLKWLRFFEFSLLFICLLLQKKDFFDFKKIIRLLSWSSLIVSIIVILEFLGQKSLGLQYLGEWYFSKNQPGVSSFFIFNQKFVRPRATFPHPNITSFYLALSLLVNLYGFYKDKTKKGIFLVIVNLIAALFTFSRLGVLIIFLYLISFYLFFFNSNLIKDKQLFSRILKGVLILFGPVLFFRFFSLLKSDYSSIGRRSFLVIESEFLVQANLKWGIGVNNFLRVLDFSKVGEPYFFFEPVHNFYLLFLVENGLFLFLFFLGFILYAFFRQLFLFLERKKFRNYLMVCFWIGFLIVSFGDHYFYSLYQGNLMLFLFLSFSFLID